jgi:hypothetical protein
MGSESIFSSAPEANKEDIRSDTSNQSEREFEQRLIDAAKEGEDDAKDRKK